MSAVSDALAPCAKWGRPAEVEGNAFRLVCRLTKPAANSEVAAAWPERLLVQQLRDLWATTRAADLFVDSDFGQWGLRLLSPEYSALRSRTERAQRPREMRPDDVVIGEFLGDLGLLVMDGEGRMLIALALDSRSDWDRPAETLAEFLGRYVATKGARFWTEQRG